MSNKLIVILGPTAAGKSTLAVKLAKKFNGEIISADSRQIYKEMDIGTNKIKVKETSGIRHHLLGILPPDKSFSSGEFQKKAVKQIKAVQKRNKIPFLVGGSPFYIYPVVEGWIFPKTKTNKAERKRLEKNTAAELWQKLKKLDPQRAKTIDKNNKRRLVRAIEIAEQLGKVPKLEKTPQFSCLIIGINPPKEELKERINERVNKMIKAGLEKEVRRLVKKYGWTSALESIGYQEWKEYFEGKTKKEEVVEKIKKNTLQLAKRQMKWFKKPVLSKENKTIKIHWIKNIRQTEKLIKKFLKNK